MISKEERQAKLTLLKNDTAYKRFQHKLAAIMKTAKGRNTNYAAVQKLFTANKPMLTGLKKRHNVSGMGIVLHKNNQYLVNEDRPVAQVATNTNLATILKRSVSGPFQTGDVYDAGGGAWDIGREGEKITWTIAPGDQQTQLGAAAFYAVAEIDVPDDPQILSVFMNIQYSYFTTGWDTEGASIAPILAYWVDGLNSVTYQNKPESDIPIVAASGQRFKVFKTFFTKQFDVTGQYTHESQNASFGFGGNVTPGRKIILRVAFGYEAEGNHTGDFGAYHYGEFELKQIKLQYSKGSE